MFDLTSSKLLILFVVALVVVGPKDLPVLLRTVGKYLGMIRRQAAEFRSQFDEAMRDQELSTLKAEMDAMKRDVTETVHGTRDAMQADLAATTREIDLHMSASETSTPSTSTPSAPDNATPGHTADAQQNTIHASAPHINGSLPPTAIAEPALAPKAGV